MLSDVYDITLEDVHATELAGFYVKEGKLETVKNAILNRQQVLEENGSMYLPEQDEFVRNYKLIEKGNYLFFVMAENAEAISISIDCQF